ncbi:catalase family peroxidase [Pseudomonas neuropathica]
MNAVCLQRLLIGAVLAGTLASSSALSANDTRNDTMAPEPLYDALLDALNATFGRHPGFRATHAKGLLVNGTFKASPNASTLSRAAHLQGQTVPVVLRFSNFSGVPATADGDPLASPRGLAVRFTLAGGEVTDIVTHSFDGFPVATPEDFLIFLQGIAANVATPPDPLPLHSFLAGHPRARAFLDAPKPAPRSYAGLEYFAVNALVFSNHRGVETIGRYRIEPLLMQPLLSDAEAAAKPADYLQSEMTEQLAKGSLTLRLVLQLASAEDAIEDGSVAWSRQHQEIELGIFSLDSLEPADAQFGAQQQLAFSPGRLLDGISLSADPMTLARDRIYQRAVLRRQQR